MQEANFVTSTLPIQANIASFWELAKGQSTVRPLCAPYSQFARDPSVCVGESKQRDKCPEHHSVHGPATAALKLHSPSAAGHLCLPQLTGTEVQGLNSHCAQGLTFKPQHDENEHKSWGKEKGACHQLWQLALNEETEKCHGSHVHRHQKICKQ